MLKRILKYLLIAIIAAYAFFAFIIIPSSQETEACKGVLVNVDDNGMDIITPDEIIGILKNEGLDPTGKILDNTVCGDIEFFMNIISLIEECQVYKSIKGYVVVNVDCRIPIVTVHDEENSTYHIDKDGNIINGIHKALYLPVASGHIDTSRTKDITAIVKEIDRDDFWSSQIEQIYFDKKGKIVLVPRVGNHIIEFGGAENIEKKFQKLYTFYHNGMNNIGWNKYSKLNIEFSDKVICTKRDRYGKK